MKLKNTIGLIIFAVILSGLTIRTVMSGIAGLSNSEYAEPSIDAKRGKLCEVEIVSAGEVYTIDRRLLGFIPVETERFFSVRMRTEQFPCL